MANDFGIPVVAETVTICYQTRADAVIIIVNEVAVETVSRLFGHDWYFSRKAAG